MERVTLSRREASGSARSMPNFKSSEQQERMSRILIPTPYGALLWSSGSLGGWDPSSASFYASWGREGILQDRDSAW